jgi:hypothetical protein
VLSVCVGASLTDKKHTRQRLMRIVGNIAVLGPNPVSVLKNSRRDFDCYLFHLPLFRRRDGLWCRAVRVMMENTAVTDNSDKGLKTLCFFLSVLPSSALTPTDNLSAVHKLW